MCSSSKISARGASVQGVKLELRGNDRRVHGVGTAALATTNWYFNWDLRMVPDEYVDYGQELKAIRTNVAMGDVSPLQGNTLNL